MKERFAPRHQREIPLKENSDLLQQRSAPRHQRENLLKNELNGSITFPLTKENQNESLRFTL